MSYGVGLAVAFVLGCAIGLAGGPLWAAVLVGGVAGLAAGAAGGL